MSKRKPTLPIENTTRDVQDDPASSLRTAMVLGGSGAIELAEANGQTQLVHSDQIPRLLMHGLTEDHLKAMGFVLGPHTSGDPLFRQADLPPGWRKEQTDHSMWSKVVDEKGRKRLAIFYKAASYDRAAHMAGSTRFHFSTYERAKDRPGKLLAVITDGDKPVVEIGERDEDDYAAGQGLRAACLAWLAENRPRWEDPMAYWDED